jgi:hypothetical protein
VSPDRIVFADHFPVDKHLLQKRRLVDIVLDPRKHSTAPLTNNLGNIVGSVTDTSELLLLLTGGLMSTADALWAGIPVITLFDVQLLQSYALSGPLQWTTHSPPWAVQTQAAMVHKNAGSVLTAMGLQEEGLIVDSLEAYKAKAVALASDAKARRALVKKIKQSRYTQHLIENICT